MVSTAPFVSAKSPTPDRSLTPSIGLLAALLTGLADSLNTCQTWQRSLLCVLPLNGLQKDFSLADLLKADSVLTPTLHGAPFDRHAAPTYFTAVSSSLRTAPEDKACVRHRGCSADSSCADNRMHHPKTADGSLTPHLAACWRNTRQVRMTGPN